MYNKFYEVDICQHFEGEVIDFTVEVVSDSEDGARKIVKSFFGGEENEDGSVTTFCLRFIGECTPLELETIFCDESYYADDEDYEFQEEEG